MMAGREGGMGSVYYITVSACRTRADCAMIYLCTAVVVAVVIRDKKYNTRERIMCRSLKKNLNAPSLSVHPPVRGKGCQNV